MRGKLQLIAIENETGRIKTLKIDRRKFKALFIIGSIFMLLTTVYSIVLTLHSLSYYKQSKAKISNLSCKLQNIEGKNQKLSFLVNEYRERKAETIRKVASRVKIIDSIMKTVGLKVPKPITLVSEGGIAIPIDDVKDFDEVNLSPVLPKLDFLIKNMKTLPIVYPTRGRITSPFGWRTNPITHRLEFHLGVDIANRTGTPIKAPADGKVLWAGRYGLLGNAVIIDHGNGIVTYYGHMSKVIAKKGKLVKRGEIIGLMGSTGRSTGPHLHYGIKYKGKWVNPMIFLEALKDVQKGKES